MKIKRVSVIVVFAMVVLSLFSCNIQTGEEEAAPVLYSISPQTKVSHLPGFTMLVTGEHFKQGSVVIFNGIEKQTQYVSSTALNCRIETEDITLGSATVSEGNMVSRVSSQEVSVLVRNPSTGGNSNALNFTITDNHTFTAPVNITDYSGSTINDFDLEVDDAGGIYISYLSNPTNQSGFNLYLTNSVDGGSTWEQTVEIPNTSSAFLFHDMAIGSAGDINVAWNNGVLNNDVYRSNIYFSLSANGLTWVNPVQVNVNKEEVQANRCLITTDRNGYLYSLYEEYTNHYRNFSLLASRSTDNGVSWSLPVTILSNEAVQYDQRIEQLKSIVTRDQNEYIYALWNYKRHTESKDESMLYSSRSEDMGVSWSEPVVIRRQLSLYRYHIANDSDGNLNLVWNETDEELYFQRFSDDGAPLSDVIEIFPGGEFTWKICRAIAVDSAGNINILFDAQTQDDEWASCFSRSIDNGQTWSQPLSIHYQDFMYDFLMRVDKAGGIYITSFYYTRANMNLYFCGSKK